MRIEDFEKELQTIDKDLSIRPNKAPQRVLDMFPDVDKIASILYCGVELCTIPNYEIFDEPNGNYGVDLRQDGRFIAHRTRPQALEIVKQKLGQIKNDKEYADAFFGRGEYSDSELRRKEAPVPELVEEVSAEIKPIQGGMIEEAK
jgi:hypothetical protein